MFGLDVEVCLKEAWLTLEFFLLLASLVSKLCKDRDGMQQSVGYQEE